MFTVTTSILKGTGTSGGQRIRVKSAVSSGRGILVPYDYELSTYGNHVKAARALIDGLSHSSLFNSHRLPDGDWVHLVVDPDHDLDHLYDRLSSVQAEAAAATYYARKGA